MILASRSPRRRALLAQLGLEGVFVLPPEGDELLDPALSPREQAMELSRQKAAEVAAQVGPEELILAADTLVVADDIVLGKPESPADAARMLALLSGREHRVVTGLTLRRGETVLTQCEVTEVTMRPLTQGEIAAYVATGEPMDKAGAYGIQGLGCLLVEGIQGDYNNVVGLPLCRLGRMLEQFGVRLLSTGEEGPP